VFITWSNLIINRNAGLPERDRVFLAPQGKKPDKTNPKEVDIN